MSSPAPDDVQLPREVAAWVDGCCEGGMDDPNDVSARDHAAVYFALLELLNDRESSQMMARTIAARWPDEQPLARYECLVHASNRNSSYGTPVSVLAPGVREARERAIAVGWGGHPRDARVTIVSVTDVGAP